MKFTTNKKGQYTLWIGVIAGLSVVGVLFLIMGYNAGWFAGQIVGDTTPTAGIGCELGSIKVSNYPDGLLCYWNQGEGDMDKVIFNYTILNNATYGDKDLGHGYLTLTADEGCVADMKVSAISQNTTAFVVRGASPDKNFMRAGYEHYPLLTNPLLEDESLVYEYHVTLKSNVGWPNATGYNLTLHVQAPEEGCDDDVGDGVCDWDERIEMKNLQWTDQVTNTTLPIGGTNRLDVALSQNSFGPNRLCSQNVSCVWTVSVTTNVTSNGCWLQTTA